MRLGATLLLFVTALPTSAHGQLSLTGYTLGVGTHQNASDVGSGGQTLLGRVRLMPVLSIERVTIDIAYEHVVLRTPTTMGFSITAPGGSAARVGDWLGASWEIRTTPRGSWRHRFDRLSVGLSGDRAEVTVGRQAISWANTLFLTPADPFSPFDPSDPFREYRGGVDAVRVRLFAGPFSEVEAVVRPTETALGTTTTALVRAQTSRGGWAFGAWAGALHDDPAGAVYASGAVGGTALRTEVAIREDVTGGMTLRGAVGLDRFFSVSGRDASAVIEFQYDGFGARSASRLLEVYVSKSFLRGEMQTLGELTLATSSSYQVHPLVGVSMLALLNPRDGSLLLSPGLAWSASSSASVSIGAFTGVGAGLGAEGAPGSEYGSVPALAFLSTTWFF